MRFFSSISDRGIDAYVDRINWANDTCFGHFSDGDLVGFVHLAYVDETQREFGISVLPNHQKDGLGKTMMKRVITWCKAEGVTELVMECLRENKAMNKIARRLGMRIVNDHETAIASAALQTTFAERIYEIQKNMTYENIAIVDKSMRAFYNQALSWGVPNDHK
jgi:RimJ/RimL family protein N-acetyltransferase